MNDSIEAASRGARTHAARHRGGELLRRRLRHHEALSHHGFGAAPLGPRAGPQRLPLHPGRLGETVSIEQGIEAAELTAMNALAGMKQALGCLERIVSLIKSLNFVACAPDFTDVHLVSTAMADRLVEVLGPARGIGARATIGVQSLAGNHCFESWIEVEIR